MEGLRVMDMSVNGIAGSGNGNIVFSGALSSQYSTLRFNFSHITVVDRSLNRNARYDIPLPDIHHYQPLTTFIHLHTTSFYPLPLPHSLLCSQPLFKVDYSQRYNMYVVDSFSPYLNILRLFRCRLSLPMRHT